MRNEQDAYRLQLKLFLSEVRQQQLLSSVRSFLKLYSAIPIAKLAAFMEIDEPTLRYLYTTIAMNHICFWDYDHDLYSLFTEWLF